MKRKRTILICLALVLFMMSLTSCRWLEEKRARHAKWNNEEQTEVVWGNAHYKLLPETELSDSLYEDWVYITEPDVPVLAAPMAGFTANTGFEGKLMFYGTIDDRTGKYVQRIFARDDAYEEFKGAIESGVIDRYGAVLYAVDLENGLERKVTVLLDDKAVSLLEDALARDTEPMSGEEEEHFYENHYAIGYDEEYSARGVITFFRCDKTMLLRESTAELMAYEAQDGSGSRAYLLSYEVTTEDYYMHYGDYAADEQLYRAVMDLLKDAR